MGIVPPKFMPLSGLASEAKYLNFFFSLFTGALVAGVMASKNKIHHENGTQGELLDPQGYQKKYVTKSVW